MIADRAYQAAEIPLHGPAWVIAFGVVILLMLVIVVLRVKRVGGPSPGERRDRRPRK